MSKISARRTSAREAGAAEYAKKRKEILHTAAVVFKEMGYEAATVDDVAKRAMIDRASLYYYFKGKKDLFREMVGEATSDNVDMAESIAASDRTPEEKLRNLIVALFESYARHYPYLYVYLQEDMSRLAQDNSPWSNNIIALNRRFDVAVTGIVKEGIDKGSFRSKGSPKLIVAGILGMCNWSHRWFRVDGSLPAGEIADVFADMALSGLLTGSAKSK